MLKKWWHVTGPADCWTFEYLSGCKCVNKTTRWPVPSKHISICFPWKETLTILKNMHKSEASDEHTPMFRRFDRVNSMTDSRSIPTHWMSCALWRVILQAAILDAISILRGMFAPPRLEHLDRKWYNLDRETATGQLDGDISEHAGVGIHHLVSSRAIITNKDASAMSWVSFNGLYSKKSKKG